VTLPKPPFVITSLDTQEKFMMCQDMLYTKGYKWVGGRTSQAEIVTYWNKHRENTCVAVRRGGYLTYCSEDHYRSQEHFDQFCTFKSATENEINPDTNPMEVA